MTNLPTNPTKTELIEKYWFEFLLYLRGRMQSFGDYDGHVQPTESWFWDWYISNKMKSTDAS